ncbi:MAG: cytochrome c, partial [Bacteroidia bacterium]|nr:cytochrome c [Bacteroidia bacterium]
MRASLVYCSAIVLFFSCTQTSGKREETFSSVTWSEHIAPIIYKNCSPCHRQGQSGPFNLLSYADAIKKAKQIKFVTKTKYMPPWPADVNYTHFVGERSLTDDQIKQISDWVDSNMPRGDSAKEITAPIFNNISFFGKPDLVIKAQKAVEIKGNGTDAFLILKFPYQVDRDTIADIIEFVPHQRKLVHHVNGHLISYDENRQFNYTSGENIHSD